MSYPKPSHTPHYLKHGAYPFLAVDSVREEVELLQEITGALDPDVAMQLPNGDFGHVMMMIGSTPIMIAPKNGMEAQATMYVYVPDPEAALQRARARNLEIVQEVQHQFYGDRAGAFRDPSGNIWWVAHHQEQLNHGQLQERFNQELLKRAEPSRQI